MRRLWILVLLAAMALSGCSGSVGQPNPDWEKSWVRIGDIIGVEPMEDFSLNESNDVLSISGLYYATWTCGDGKDYVNTDGDDAIIYDAQIYVLLQECRDSEAAAQTVDTWIAREKQSYTAGETDTESFGTQVFDLLPLSSGKAGNPYSHGIAAFAVREQWAISVELVCSDGFTGNPQSVLARFLTGFHYSGE